MHREELEYHLETDVTNYGKRYEANPDSRWGTPEFSALAADAVRKLQVLQSEGVLGEDRSHIQQRHESRCQDHGQRLRKLPT